MKEYPCTVNMSFSLSLCKVEEKTRECILSVSVVDCPGLVLSAKPEEPRGTKEEEKKKTSKVP